MIVTEHFGKVLKSTEKPKYKVFKVYRNSARREILYKNLSLEEAKRIVNSFPNRKKSMVCFTKQ
jgi:ribosomal protein L7/L12